MRRFEKTSIYYRCLCEETCEEQIFTTEKEAVAWSQKVVDTFERSWQTFTLVRVVESSRRFTRDKFERENYLPTRT